MSTITQISTAIKTLLDTLPDIDQSSLDTYLPSINTRKVALLMPPMGLSGTVGAPVGRRTRLIHRIPCELWIKVDKGNATEFMARGREVCLNAAAKLQASLTLSDTVGFLGDGGDGPPFVWEIDENIFDLGKAAFVRATLFVTVTEWVTLQE